VSVSDEGSGAEESGGPRADAESFPADTSHAASSPASRAGGQGSGAGMDPTASPGEAPSGVASAPEAGIVTEAERDIGSPTKVRSAADEAPADPVLASPEGLRAVLEAVLLVVDTPTSAVLLAQVLGRPVAEVEAGLRGLSTEYDAGGRGIDLREVAGGWRLYTREEFAPYVERFVLEGQQARLTQAALETLAVIAYRQPVTRSRVSAVRGVNVDAVMRTLLGRGLVEECGVDPESGGGLYRTTPVFLEKLGLSSLADLPSLAPLLPDTSQLDDVALST
jgi:segregation and condensation protein B